MGVVEIGLPADPEIDRHQHQSSAMRDGNGERPQGQLRRANPCQSPWMTLLDQPEDAESDHQQAGADLDLALPFHQRGQQCKGKQDKQHGEQMARSKRT